MTKIVHNVVSTVQAKMYQHYKHKTKANSVGVPKSNKDFQNWAWEGYLKERHGATKEGNLVGFPSLSAQSI